MRMHTCVVLLILLLGTPLLTARTARAEPDPRTAYATEIRRIRSMTDCATKQVIDALRQQDWNAWTVAHTRYANTLQIAVTEIETASTRFLFAVLNSGGTLDAPVQKALNDGGNLAALLAKRRVVAGAYAALTRQGVRPDRRANALSLLDRQGVYGNPGPNPCIGTGPAAPAPEALANVSPLTGRVPGSPEATEHLRKWQYAFMRESTMRRSVEGKEAELAALSPHAPNRAELQTELSQLKSEHQQLEDAVTEWRTKYFQAGGR